MAAWKSAERTIPTGKTSLPHIVYAVNCKLPSLLFFHHLISTVSQWYSVHYCSSVV